MPCAARRVDKGAGWVRAAPIPDPESTYITLIAIIDPRQIFTCPVSLQPVDIFFTEQYEQTLLIAL